VALHDCAQRIVAAWRRERARIQTVELEPLRDVLVESNVAAERNGAWNLKAGCVCWNRLSANWPGCVLSKA
jgi:hypothetical protein